MRILCAISGVDFNVQHFPGYLTEREAYHPIFTMKQSVLLAQLKKWAAHELTDIDSYLLYLSLLNSTSLVQWRVPAKRHDGTKAIVSNHMESLARVIGKINLVSHPSFVLHKIAITPDTCDLMTSHFWIENWNQSYHSFANGYREEIKHDKVARREQVISRFLKDPHISVERIAKQLAEWASDAAEFPTRNITINGKQTTLAEYWKSLIIRCATNDRVFLINPVHLENLEDYCFENIEPGSSYSKVLFAALKAGVEEVKNPFGIFGSDFDITHPGFKILPRNQISDIEAINREAMIASAPTSRPIESAYPSKIAFLRARFAYDAAEEARKQKEIDAAAIEPIVEFTSIPIEPVLIPDSEDIDTEKETEDESIEDSNSNTDTTDSTDRDDEGDL